MYLIPRCFKVEGYDIRDFRENLTDAVIEIVLHRKHDKPLNCYKCSTQLQSKKGEHELRLEHLPVMQCRTFYKLKRWKGYCSKCQKVRSEECELIAEESPHLTQDYAWWLGRLCEIAPVSRAAELNELDDTTLWRIDFKRMQKMLEDYELPEVKRISVDEVHATRKRAKGDTRDDEFFTVVCDLDTGKAIFTAKSRRREALDAFFIALGNERCQAIEGVATDQHEGYAASIREHVPWATHVWDKFHIMQNFEEAVNETRKSLHSELDKKDPLFPMTRGKYRFAFTKRASKRSQDEQSHIDEVLKENESFAQLELIKERMLNFFDSGSMEEAKNVWAEIGNWIWQKQFQPLMRWYRALERGWDTLVNYFMCPVTSALSEGINNVIKTLKRKAFGYRNMVYFRLKILQTCGYLNSRYIRSWYDLKSYKKHHQHYQRVEA